MVLLCVLAILVVIFLAVLYACYRMGFYYRDPQAAPQNYHTDEQIQAVRPVMDACILDFQQAAFENVSITSFDALDLTGRYYHNADNAPLYIQMHGYKGNALRDFCGTWAIARELGHNVLLIDQRAHGSSGGHTITFGIREHRDCLSWTEYACRRFGNIPVVLMGVSMGAATVLMASGLDLPKNVKAVVADCPYDAPASIIKQVVKAQMGMPVRLVYPLIRLSGRLYGRFDLESCSPLEAVKRSQTPVLLIHGEDDRFVPCRMSRNLREAAPETVCLHTIPGSGHALNQVYDPALYRSILVPFLKKHLTQ